MEEKTKQKDNNKKGNKRHTDDGSQADQHAQSWNQHEQDAKHQYIRHDEGL